MGGTPQPLRSVLSKDRIIIFIFMFFSLLYLFLFFNQGINRYDEGLIVYGATRILDGDTPYKDFWAIYSPAQFYIMAAMFKIFGTTIIVARTWFTVIRFILLMVSYLIARKFVSQKNALLASALLLIWLGPFQYYGNPMHIALLFSLLSFLSLLAFLSQRLKRWLFLSGVLVGVATLFRQDAGFYTLVSSILVIIPFVFINATSKDDSFYKRFLHVTKFGFCFVSGSIIILLPTLIYFLLVVPADDLVYDFITFPLKVYPAFRALPYPAPMPNPSQLFSGLVSIKQYIQMAFRQLPLYSPFLIYLITGFSLAVRIRKKVIDWKQWNIWGLIFILLLGLLFLNYVRVRTHLSHLMGTIIPAILLYVILLSFIPKSGKLRPVIWIFAFLLGILFVGSSIEKTEILLADGLFSQSKQYYSLERARGIYEKGNWVSHYQNAIKYIQEKVPENEKIFVGSTRHDRIIWNDILFYFLSNRHSATKYYDLHPGITTTAEIQEKIIKAIEICQVEYIVLLNQKGQRGRKKWENDRIGSRILDNFIQDNFTQKKEFGNYLIWKRNR